jgi:MFS family permease
MVSTSRGVVVARPMTPAPRSQAARFLVAVGISFYGDWLTTVALVVLLYRTTGSATAPALYIVARVAPRVFGPAPGGALADRFGAARIAAACSLLQAAFTGLIVVFAHSRVVWAIYVAVACAQFLNSLAQPAYGALIPQVTSERQLGRVNGIYSTLFSSSILVSPAIGALLLPRVAPELLIAVDAATFLVAALILITVRTRVAPVPGSSRRGVSIGLPVVMRDGMLRSFAAASLGNPAVITALQAVLVVAASQRFGHDTDVGWLYAAVGAGGIVGGLSFLRPTPSRIGRRAIVVATFIELGPVVVFVFAPNVVLAGVLLFLSSLGGVLYQVRGSIGLQQRVPTELLGRVNAVIRSGMYIGMLIGAVTAAALVQPLGWQATVLIVAAAAFAFLVVASLVQPRRRFQHPAELIPD